MAVSGHDSGWARIACEVDGKCPRDQENGIAASQSSRLLLLRVRIDGGPQGTRWRSLQPRCREGARFPPNACSSMLAHKSLLYGKTNDLSSSLYVPGRQLMLHLPAS